MHIIVYIKISPECTVCFGPFVVKEMYSDTLKKIYHDIKPIYCVALSPFRSPGSLR